MSIYRSDPAAPGANLRRRPRPSAPLDQAVEYFNASGAGRTVVGLARSLGCPRASIGAAAGSSGDVRITIAWELCWYQWGVDQAGRVVEIATGRDVEQLDRSARHWNASLGEDARLVFGSAGAEIPRRRARWLRRR